VGRGDVVITAAQRTRRRPRTTSKTTLALLSMASVIFVLAAWSAASLTGYLRPGSLPPPWDVATAGYRLVMFGFADLTLQSHLLVSFGRFSAGFLLAASIGIPLGLVMGWSAPIRHLVSPFFEAFRFIAPLAWVPFAALWFGTGIGGPILIVFSGAFAACVINTFRGAQLVDPVLIEASRMLCASPWRLTVDVLLPGSVPSILAGLRISAALAWQALIGAELIAARSGVGYLIIQGQGSLETTIVLAGMAAIGIAGLLIDRILQLVCDSVGRSWRPAT
jgi:ABC-type nitrate/sulfonate/bicarbonate transport system permease component